MGGHQGLPEAVASGNMAFFIHPQRLARDDNVDEKEYGKLAKVRRKGDVRVGEVNILTH